ncbi:MAG: ABC transporter permease [Mediterranea massiliensis]|nr:ABC transporter permease [Mediterranea massiliensis]
MIDTLQELYATIKRNKLRTALTGLAVSWGIFMLIVLLGAGNGLIHAFEQSSSERALNSMRIYPGTTTLPYDGLTEGRFIQLDNRDLKDTEELFTKHIVSAGATLQQGNVNVSYDNQYVNISLQGVYPNYTDIEAIKIIEGRFFNANDLKDRRKVIVLHEKSAEVLFKKKSAIGTFVNANGIAYQVIGIYEDSGNSNANYAFIPFTTLQIIYNKGNKLNNIVFTTKGLSNITDNEAFEETYRKAIAQNHRFDPTDEGSIWIWNRMTQYLSTQEAMGLLRTAIWVIGIFTLLSGIVGVSNIMLITVKERTREFGIRKALGAKPRHILWLIIIESVAITTLFGYIGMVAGIGVTEWMDSLFGNQSISAGNHSETIFTDPTVDISIAIQATLTLIVAGTLAGFFPARKAANIRPVEAMNSV